MLHSVLMKNSYEQARPHYCTAYAEPDMFTMCMQRQRTQRHRTCPTCIGGRHSLLPNHVQESHNKETSAAAETEASHMMFGKKFLQLFCLGDLALLVTYNATHADSIHLQQSTSVCRIKLQQEFRILMFVS